MSIPKNLRTLKTNFEEADGLGISNVGNIYVHIKMRSLKFIYSEKATISTVGLSYVVTVKSTVEILQKFVVFSEYMNFTILGIVLSEIILSGDSLYFKVIFKLDMFYSHSKSNQVVFVPLSVWRNVEGTTFSHST